MSYTPPPPPPPPMQGGPGMPGGYAQPQTNQKAMWSMILGIVGLVCCGLFAGIPALILGNLAKKEINASGGAQTGGGMATAGVILGIIAIVWSIISGILFATGVVTFNN
jgi:predicted acyltransferase